MIDGVGIKVLLCGIGGIEIINVVGVVENGDGRY